MNKVIDNNIRYTESKWGGYLRYLGSFLYTERIHYYYFYKKLFPALKIYNSIVKSDAILLDIGFGSGYNIKRIAKKYKIRTIGADISEYTVDIYNQNNKRNKNTFAVKIDAETSAIPLDDNSVDLIICSHVLEHVPDDARLLREIHRVLKNKGIAYLNIPINERVDDPNHVRKYTVNSFKKLLNENKFECIESIESDIFTRWITTLGIKKGFINNILKKSLILFLSFLPLSLLEKFNGIKSQFICIAVKK